MVGRIYEYRPEGPRGIYLFSDPTVLSSLEPGGKQESIFSNKIFKKANEEIKGKQN